MNELIYEIAQRLGTAGIGVFNTTDPTTRTIYIEDMPEDLVEGLMLVSAVSPPPEEYIDTEYIVIDFWARSPHNDRATALLRQVYNHLHRSYDFDTANWHVYWVRSLGSITDASRDQESSKLKRLSVQFICRNLNNES